MSPILRTNRSCAAPGCNNKLPDGYDLMERCLKCKAGGEGSKSMSRKMSLKLSRKSEGDDKCFCRQCGVVEVTGKAIFCKDCSVDRHKKSALVAYHRKVKEKDAAKAKEEKPAEKPKEPDRKSPGSYRSSCFCDDCGEIIDRGRKYCDTCTHRRAGEGIDPGRGDPKVTPDAKEETVPGSGGLCCPKCGSGHISRRGTRPNKGGPVQRYGCKDCRHIFVLDSINFSDRPDVIDIILALSHLSTREISRAVKDEHGISLSKSTVARILQDRKPEEKKPEAKPIEDVPLESKGDDDKPDSKLYLTEGLTFSTTGTTDSDRIKQIMDLVESIEGFRVKVIIEKKI